MDFTKIRVLVTSGGARQTLTILHGLKQLGCHIAVLCSSRLDVGYASNIPHEKILDSRISTTGDDYIPFLTELLQTGKYDVILPVCEMSTNLVTQNEDELKKYVRLACASRQSYMNAFDKQKTFEKSAELNIPMPCTRLSGQSVEDYLKTVEFPLIIKPRSGMGSIGFHKFEDEENFWEYIDEKKIDLDEYVLQEFVHYEKRLGTILFMDGKGNACMAYADEVLRWFPIDAGTASLIRSIDHPEAIDYSVKLLKSMNWQGVAALSFMVDIKTGEPKLMEINGRIPASIRLSMQCGYNVAKLLLEMACDAEIEQYPVNTVFGQLTRHFHAEIPWFFKSPDKFRCEPSWFSWKNTKDVVYWSDDPKPWFAYTIGKLFTYKEFLRKRRR
ncbi:MAG: ATP-grasp domain-containing protein [Lachnospiraceae bacterium]|jgi:D-aspartate ligase